MVAASLEKCRSYLDAQMSRVGKGYVRDELPLVTISRQAMAGASEIAQLVAERLNGRLTAKDRCPWTVFDRNLVERVLEDHELPKTLDRFMPEDASAFSPGSAVEEMLGLHPSTWTLAQHTTDTIVRLARLGNVILIGRGGTVITSRFRKAVHIRLVAPGQARIRRAELVYHLTPREAALFVREKDAARYRYVKRHFHVAIDDPLLYHATINTGLTGYEGAARLIVEAVLAQEAR